MIQPFSFHAKALFFGFVTIVLSVTVFWMIHTVSADSTGFLFPVSDGNYLQWTPVTRSAHYAMVDEAACNGTTDYNYTNTVGRRDSYGIDLSAIPNGSIITQIIINPCASNNKTGGGSSTMNVFYRWNGADSADAGNYALTGTTPIVLSDTNFSGLSLAKNSSSALEIGAVLSAGTKGSRVSRLRTLLVYTPPLPAAPSNLSGTVSGSDVILSWIDNAGNEDGFKIERGTDGINFSQIATTTANTTAYTDAGLGSGTWYHRVRAFNTAGNSGYSNIATTTIP